MPCRCVTLGTTCAWVNELIEKIHGDELEVRLKEFASLAEFGVAPEEQFLINHPHVLVGSESFEYLLNAGFIPYLYQLYAVLDDPGKVIYEVLNHDNPCEFYIAKNERPLYDMLIGVARDYPEMDHVLAVFIVKLLSIREFKSVSWDLATLHHNIPIEMFLLQLTALIPDFVHQNVCQYICNRPSDQIIHSSASYVPIEVCMDYAPMLKVMFPKQYLTLENDMFRYYQKFPAEAYKQMWVQRNMRLFADKVICAARLLVMVDMLMDSYYRVSGESRFFNIMRQIPALELRMYACKVIEASWKSPPYRFVESTTISKQAIDRERSIEFTGVWWMDSIS
jgi:hypothetical protein